MALARLVEAQQKFSDEALNVARRTLRKERGGSAPEPGFVPGGPWALPSTCKVVSSAHPLLSVAAASLPRYELAAVRVNRKPPQVRRPGLALASGSHPTAAPQSMCAPLWNLSVCVPALPALSIRLVSMPSRSAIPLVLDCLTSAVAPLAGHLEIQPGHLFCIAPRSKTQNFAAICSSETVHQVWNSAPVGIGEATLAKPAAVLLDASRVTLPRPRRDTAVDCTGVLDSSAPVIEELNSSVLAEAVGLKQLASMPSAPALVAGLKAPLETCPGVTIPGATGGYAGCELDDAAEVALVIGSVPERSGPEFLAAEPMPLDCTALTSLVPEFGCNPTAAQLSFPDNAAALGAAGPVANDSTYAPKLSQVAEIPAVSLPKRHATSITADPAPVSGELLAGLALNAVNTNAAELLSAAPISIETPSARTPVFDVQPAGCVPEQVCKLSPLAVSFTAEAGTDDPSHLSVDRVWPTVTALLSRHRATPVQPSAMKPEGVETSNETIRDAFAHYRSQANLNRHWILMALPFVLGILWLANGTLNASLKT